MLKQLYLEQGEYGFVILMAKMVWVVMMSVNWHKKKKVKQEGFTLIELMIAMMLGLIVIGGALSIYISTVSSSSNTIKSARLNYDLESAMSLMMNDIKRAGYWGGATDGVTAFNPFTNNDALTGAVSNIAILDTGACILYSYDADEDGFLDDSSTNIGTNPGGGYTAEYYGFKFDTDSIKIWSSTVAEGTADCTANGWENFIDENKLKITLVQFSFESIDALANGNSRCWNQTQKESDDVDADICTANAVNGDYIIQNRMVNIKLSGEVKSDDSVEKNLSGTVEVRNNRICVRDAANTCP